MRHILGSGVFTITEHCKDCSVQNVDKAYYMFNGLLQIFGIKVIYVAMWNSHIKVTGVIVGNFETNP